MGMFPVSMYVYRSSHIFLSRAPSPDLFSSTSRRRLCPNMPPDVEIDHISYTYASSVILGVNDATMNINIPPRKYAIKLHSDVLPRFPFVHPPHPKTSPAGSVPGALGAIGTRIKSIKSKLCQYT